MKHLPDWQHWLQGAVTHTRNWERKYLTPGFSRSLTPSIPPQASLLSPRSPINCLCQRIHDSRRGHRLFPPLMFGVTVLSLTSIVGYRFYNQPQLGVDSVAPTTIVAPYSREFIDQKTTEERRKDVRTGIIPRLKRDNQLTQVLVQSRGELLDQINQLRRVGAPFPFVNSHILSLLEQQRLRSSSEDDWQQQQTKIVWPESFSPQEQQLIIERIEAARQRYQRALNKLSKVRAEQLSNEGMVAALQLNDPTWYTTQQTIIQVFDRILAQGLPAGIPPDLLRETLQLHLRNTLPPQANAVAEDILFALLENQYNLTLDKEATKEQAEQAAQAVAPIAVAVEKGEVIVKAGQKINQSQFVLLDGFNLSQRGINWEGLGLTAGLVTGAVLIFGGVSQRIHRPLRRRDHLLLCLLSLSSPLMAFLHPRYNDLPAIGLLVGSFYGPTLAVSQVLLVGGLSIFALEANNWEYLVAGMAAGILAGLISGRLRSRDDLARLGAGIGIVQGGVYIFSYLVIGSLATVIWSTVLPGALIFGLLGTAWTIVAIGFSPYLERFFDVVTPIRLVELANPNCPLLQRLAKEAPGTFQHTLFVACLAESAARELRCNVELVRAGTLYHDIGKMHDPLGFIENQMGGVNKHDQINDPYLSADIIKKHVTLGLEMARQYGLPQVVRDFIPEHQGTLLISYFYYQAKENAEKQGTTIAEEDFRYDGPTPQSRETGIVMLADSAEAALRSLKDTDIATAKVMVNRIFKARWRDNQLQQSGLKYEELPIIAEVFVRVWQQFHHQRIVYPKAALEARPTLTPGQRV